MMRKIDTLVYAIFMFMLGAACLISWFFILVMVIKGPEG
jgi:hypothetical protein